MFTMLNVIAALVLAATQPKKPSISLAAPVDPVVAAKTHDQLAANLTPSAKSKLASAATSIRTSSAVTDTAAKTAVTSAFPGLSDSDTQALMFMAMMEASSGAQQDLQNITAEVDKMKAQEWALQPKLAKTGAHYPSVDKIIVQVHGDYFRAPDPLPESASAEEMQKRIKDLLAMTDANQRRVQTLKNQQQQMQTIISNTFKAAQNVTLNTIKNLK